MATFKGFIIYLLCCACICTSCVHQDEVSTDTPPDEASSHAAYNPYDIQEPTDSIISYTITVTPPKHKGERAKRDTVRKVVAEKALMPHRTYEQLAAAVRKVYTSQIGVTEKTGHNDGPGPKMYLAAVGLPEHFPYCSAGVAWTFKTVGITTTITGYSPSSVNRKRLVYANHEFLQEPHFGQVVSFYYPSMGRIGHTGFYDKSVNSDIIETVEFNTSGGMGSSREGGGVYRKKKSWNMVTYCSDWIPK